MSKAAELAALIGSQTALSNRNLVINGAMQVAQRGTSFTGVGGTNAVYTVDRFNMQNNGTAGRVTVTQESVTDLPGFANALKLDVTTADTSIAAAEYFGIQTRLEGNSLQQLQKGTSSAKAVTLSFYAKGTANPMLSRKTNKFIKKAKYYLYVDSELTLIKLSKKPFSKLFQSDKVSQESILEYIKQNKLSLSKEEDLIQALNIVNK
jgi:hypothetical protein